MFNCVLVLRFHWDDTVPKTEKLVCMCSDCKTLSCTLCPACVIEALTSSPDFCLWPPKTIADCNTVAKILLCELWHHWYVLQQRQSWTKIYTGGNMYADSRDTSWHDVYMENSWQMAIKRTLNIYTSHICVCGSAWQYGLEGIRAQSGVLCVCVCFLWFAVKKLQTSIKCFHDFFLFQYWKRWLAGKDEKQLSFSNTWEDKWAEGALIHTVIIWKRTLNRSAFIFITNNQEGQAGHAGVTWHPVTAVLCENNAGL